MSRIAFFVVKGITDYLRNPKKGKEGIVRLPNLIWIIGMICSVLFLIPTFITLFTEESIWMPIFFFAFVLLGVVLIIAFLNCRIFYDEKGFLSKNFFGKKRKFTYDQIIAIKMRAHENYLCLGRQRVMIDEIAIGGMEFLAFAEEQYKKLHNGNDIPIL